MKLRYGLLLLFLTIAIVVFLISHLEQAAPRLDRYPALEETKQDGGIRRRRFSSNSTLAEEHAHRAKVRSSFLVNVKTIQDFDCATVFLFALGSSVNGWACHLFLDRLISEDLVLGDPDVETVKETNGRGDARVHCGSQGQRPIDQGVLQAEQPGNLDVRLLAPPVSKY